MPVKTKVSVKESAKSKSTATSTPAIDPKTDKEVHALPERARQIKIHTSADYQAAAEFLKSIKALRAKIDATFDPIIQHAHNTHKEAIGQKKLAEAPLIEAEGLVKGVVVVYLREQERLRLVEENRIRQENEDKIRKQSEEENFKRAQELTAQGDLDGAAQALDAPVEIPTVPVRVESSVPKVSGISLKTRYVVAEVQLMKLIQAVAVGNAPVEALKANDVFLNQQATAFKRVGELFPGVTVKTEDGVSAGKE